MRMLDIDHKECVVKLSILILFCSLFAAEAVSAATKAKLAIKNPALALAKNRVAIGEQHWCKVDTNNRLNCWMTDHHWAKSLKIPAGTADVKSVAVGSHSTCVIYHSGIVQCWGDIMIAPNYIGGAEQIAMGDEHACTISSGNLLQCWGKDNGYQISIPTELQGLNKVKAMALGRAHTCVIDMQNDVKCIGATSAIEMPLFGIGKVRQITAGMYFTCGILKNGYATCWGDKGSRALRVPSDLGKIVDIAASYVSVCAIRERDHKIQCWGNPVRSEIHDKLADALVMGKNGDFYAIQSTADDWTSGNLMTLAK